MMNPVRYYEINREPAEGSPRASDPAQSLRPQIRLVLADRRPASASVAHRIARLKATVNWFDRKRSVAGNVAAG
jgi:hypothetical protein